MLVCVMFVFVFILMLVFVLVMFMRVPIIFKLGMERLGDRVHETYRDQIVVIRRSYGVVNPLFVRLSADIDKDVGVRKGRQSRGRRRIIMQVGTTVLKYRNGDVLTADNPRKIKGNEGRTDDFDLALALAIQLIFGTRRKGERAYEQKCRHDAG